MLGWIIRVYESSDTPHITLDNGGIYVRGVATDRRVDAPSPTGVTVRERTRYEAQAIRNHGQLVELARRGERERADAQALLDRQRTPYLARELGASSLELRDWWFEEPTAVLRPCRSRASASTRVVVPMLAGGESRLTSALARKHKCLRTGLMEPPIERCQWE
jgi:hypothetical protein